LRESEEKLRRLYHSMNEGLAVHELVCNESGQPIDYGYLDMNPAAEGITGLKREAVLGKLASEIYTTEEPPFLDTFSRVAASGQPTSFEAFVPFFGKDLAVSVFAPCQGQFATLFADISKRKTAERQINLLNQAYALVSHINEAIVRIADRESLFKETCRIAVEHGRFRMAWIGLADPATETLRPVAVAGIDDGYVADARVATTASPRGCGPAGSALRAGRVVTSGDVAADPAMAPWREAALARGYRSLVSLPLKCGGAVIGVLTVYSEEPNYFTTMVTESLIEVAADLSFALDLFEKNRERELEQQQLRLQHSALDAAANAIVITDKAGAILWVNAAFTRLSGYQREEVTSQNPRLLKSGVQDSHFYSSMWKTILSGSVWQGAVRNKRKDGSLYDEEMTITPVRSETGEITHFIAIKQDITERKELELRFLRAQRMQSIGLLAGGVAHDLNNVLAPVMMALPLLRNHLNPEERERLVGTLEQSVKRGANIVQQVLTFARGVEVQRAM
ncbi:MAG: PAS domain S-box protein, partial [Chloroflexi bacterium]